MSERAQGFLIDWFTDHVQSLPEALRLAQAVRLATQCRHDATAAGIPLGEIRAAAGGDLIRKLLDALDTAARVENHAPLAPEIENVAEEAVGNSAQQA
jgi:hypothetical protein